MAATPSVGILFRRYPFATVCGALGLVLVAGLALRFGALDDAHATLQRQTAENAKIDRNVRNAIGLEDNLAALKSGLARLEDMLTKVDDVSANQAFFYRLESVAGVRVSILRPLGLPKTTGKAVPGTYQPTGFNVVVEGAYPQVASFLQSLERGSRLYRLTDFTLQRNSQEQADSPKEPKVVLNLNFQLLAAK